MIVKFDHITFVGCKSQKKNITINKALFVENGVVNTPGKTKFMRLVQPDADVIFDGNGDLPTEYVFYDEITGKSSIKVEGNHIFSYYTEDAGRIRDILINVIGASEVEDLNRRNDIISFNLKGVFDTKDYYIHFTREENNQFYRPMLDWSGWQCPCLLVDSLYRICNVLDNREDVDYSIDSLVINGRALKICFIGIQGMGTIIELIAPDDVSKSNL